MSEHRDEDIVITGMGAVTPLGVGVDAYWTNLIDGACGVDTIDRFDVSELPVRIAALVSGFDPAEHVSKKLLRQMDAFSIYAYVAANEAIQNSLGAEEAAVDHDRVGMVAGTAMGGVVPTLKAEEDYLSSTRKSVSPRVVPRILSNIAAAHIAMEHGFRGPNLTVSTACSSGNDAIITAARLLSSSEADVMLAIGMDSIISPLVISSLASTGSLSKDNDHPAQACRPFDEAHDGFVMGEGGGALVLEKRSHARERGAKVLGRLVGWSSNNDAYHIVAPMPTGDMAERCMRGALAMAGVHPSRIGYINAHATGTPTGDTAEAGAIARVFEGHHPLVGSTKAATGHMMGAGGITEAIACLKAMSDSIVPPTLNLTDPAYQLDFAETESVTAECEMAMSNAFGFGGQNSSIVLSRD